VAGTMSFHGRVTFLGILLRLGMLGIAKLGVAAWRSCTRLRVGRNNERTGGAIDDLVDKLDAVVGSSLRPWVGSWGAERPRSRQRHGWRNLGRSRRAFDIGGSLSSDEWLWSY